MSTDKSAQCEHKRPKCPVSWRRYRRLTAPTLLLSYGTETRAVWVKNHTVRVTDIVAIPTPNLAAITAAMDDLYLVQNPL